MTRKFDGADVHPWKVVTNTGKTVDYPAKHEKAGKPMNDLTGYGDAARLAPAGTFPVRA